MSNPRTGMTAEERLVAWEEICRRDAQWQNSEDNMRGITAGSVVSSETRTTDPFVVVKKAAEKIRFRIENLEMQRRNYFTYQQDRVNERDHHGAWDVAINLSEVECEQAGLRFALEALGETP